MGITGMFRRRNRRKVDRETFEYWTLVEIFRTGRDPLQWVVARLGKLPGLDEEERHGWEEICLMRERKAPPRHVRAPISGFAAASQSSRHLGGVQSEISDDRDAKNGRVFPMRGVLYAHER